MEGPIDRLLAEHREIMDELQDLRRAVLELADRGDPAVPVVLPALQAVGRMMATRLLAHARREDEALFPALEAVLGAAGSPTEVMRREHADIHAQAERFRRTLRELNEVEHPAIVAGGAALAALAEGRGSADQLRATGAEVLSLIDAHFQKEEEILFPMARQILDARTLREVARQMDAIEPVE